MAATAWHPEKGNLRISLPSSGLLGIKFGNKEKRNALDLENGRDVEKRRSVFQKMGDFIFSTTAFLGTGENWHLIEKRCFYQFLKLTLELRP